MQEQEINTRNRMKMQKNNSYTMIGINELTPKSIEKNYKVHQDNTTDKNQNTLYKKGMHSSSTKLHKNEIIAKSDIGRDN